MVAKKPDNIRADQIGDVVARLRGTDIFPHAMLALFGGLRAGEVLALRWRSVDLEARSFTSGRASRKSRAAIGDQDTED